MIASFSEDEIDWMRSVTVDESGKVLSTEAIESPKASLLRAGVITEKYANLFVAKKFIKMFHVKRVSTTVKECKYIKGRRKMAVLGVKHEPFEGRTTLGTDGKKRSVESHTSAYVLASNGFRPRERRIWKDREDGSEYVVIRKDGKAALMPVKPVYNSKDEVCMYEMVCVGDVTM